MRTLKFEADPDCYVLGVMRDLDDLANLQPSEVMRTVITHWMIERGTRKVLPVTAVGPMPWTSPVSLPDGRVRHVRYGEEGRLVTEIYPDAVHWMKAIKHAHRRRD